MVKAAPTGVYFSTMNPNYPRYIVSKGRWESRLASRALESMRVPYHNVINPDEYEQYLSVIDSEIVRVLPQHNREDMTPVITWGIAREINLPRYCGVCWIRTLP